MGCNCGKSSFTGANRRLSTSQPATSPQVVQSSTLKTGYIAPTSPTGPAHSQTLRKTV